MASFVVRTLRELGHDRVLAPDRHLAAGLSPPHGVPLDELVRERDERVARPPPAATVVDTTHARDGLLDALRLGMSREPPHSGKRLAFAGDILVSRLRPYLRQIAYVHPRALSLFGARSLACSTEFYVLAPREDRGDIAFLVPFLLGPAAQTVFAAGQEGGHHPRVPRPTLFALRVPRALVRGRRVTGAGVRGALAAYYEGLEEWKRRLEH